VKPERLYLFRLLAATVFVLGIALALLLPNGSRIVGLDPVACRNAVPGHLAGWAACTGWKESTRRPVVVRVGIAGAGTLIALVVLVIAAPTSKR